MKRSRRNHPALFKTKVALEALKGEQMLAELTQRFETHPTQITEWRRQLSKRAAEVFERPRDRTGGPYMPAMERKIGQQVLELDFLSYALGRFHGSSARTIRPERSSNGCGNR